MHKWDTVASLAAFAIAIGLGAIGFAVYDVCCSGDGTTTSKPVVRTEAGKKKATGQWSASAPGRVEPKFGEVKVTATVPGRIVNVLARTGDKVSAGDVLILLDDREPRARIRAAETLVRMLKKARDSEPQVARDVKDRREQQDRLFDAERSLFRARERLDKAVIDRREGRGSGDIARARDDVADGERRVVSERAALKKFEDDTGLPAPSKLESDLVTARAQLSLAETAFDHTRVRAPNDGTVLRMIARKGETAVPSPENLLVILGDLTGLRIRAELDERDIKKVRVGQRTMIRADAFPGREFEGRVARVAPALLPAQLGAKGPRRPTDVDVLEIFVDVTGQSELRAGMRVDVFFRSDATVGTEQSKRKTASN
ncbi:MAG: efflux RND transporter periplasmic adaptor subunit [Hyphomicrobiaceae bacterium]|nr:efflux RND transporter periplasmic adaptor subunit [Hyphomicrobiaceae bacterium]